MTSHSGSKRSPRNGGPENEAPPVEELGLYMVRPVCLGCLVSVEGWPGSPRRTMSSGLGVRTSTMVPVQAHLVIDARTAVPSRIPEELPIWCSDPSGRHDGRRYLHRAEGGGRRGPSRVSSRGSAPVSFQNPLRSRSIMRTIMPRCGSNGRSSKPKRR